MLGDVQGSEDLRASCLEEINIYTVSKRLADEPHYATLHRDQLAFPIQYGRAKSAAPLLVNGAFIPICRKLLNLNIRLLLVTLMF